MINVTDAIKQAYDVSTTQVDKIVVDNQEYRISNVEYYDDVYDEGNIFGTAIARALDFEIENIVDLEGKEVEYYTGIKINGTTQWITLGNFIVQSVEPNDTTEINKVTAMDYMLKTNIIYTSDLNYSNGDVTILDVLQEVCTNSDLTLATTDFPNKDFIVDSNQFEEGTLNRQVLQAIAQISGTVAKIKNDNCLYLINPNQITTISKVFTLNNYEEAEIKRFTHPINVVSLGMVNVEGENITLRDEESIVAEGENTLAINDNPFAYTQSKREQLITALFNAVKGFEYKSYSFRCQGLPYLETMDKVQFNDKEGNIYDSYIFRFNYKSPNGLESEIEGPSITKATVNYQNIPSLLDRLKRTEIIVDKQEGEITAIVEQTTIVKEQVDNITNTTAETEGKSIHITDSAEEPLVDISLHGETNQATRSGKNLFDKDNTEIITGKYLNSEGVLNAGSSWGITDYIKVSPNTNYISHGLSSTGTNPSVVFYDSNKNFIEGLKHKNANPFIFNTPENCVYIRESFYLSDIETFMIEEGSEPTAYEPYGAMPSPEFPSEIENVEGKNLFDKNTTVRGYIDYNNGQFTSNNTYTSSDFIEINANTNYYCNYTLYNSTAYGMAFYDKDKNYISGSIVANSFVTPINAKYYRFCVRNENYGGNYITDINTVQLEKGTVATEYVPYNSLAVKVTGKNLFNENAKLDNVGLAWASGNTFSENGSVVSEYLPIGKLQNLYSNYHFCAFYYDSNKVYLGNGPTLSKTGGSASLNTVVPSNNNIAYIRVTWRTVHNNSTNMTTIPDIMLTKTEEDLIPYEPYKSQTVYFPLTEGQKLMEGSYLADDGIHNLRTQKVFNGIESWYQNQTSENFMSFYLNMQSYGKINASTIWTHFKETKIWGDIQNIEEENAWYHNIASFGIKILKSRLSSLDVNGFKKWLSENPITVEYELAEEETIPYTEEQQKAWDKIKALNTYKNVTNIISEAYAKIVYMRDNGLDVYETKQNASKKYTETNTKLAEQKITVDGILSEVSNTTSKINELTGELEAINAQIAETNLSVEGLGVKVQNKGGNNLFYYDTEFWNSADIFNLEEFSDTEIKSNSISGMGYKVHNGSAYQSAEAQNGTYTVSFKYKKIGPELANASVKINDEEYSLTGTDWTDFVQIIDVTTNHITVEFISDTNNTLYVADLLGNVGTEKDVWTQNPNETRTDTVTIGKGIKVESTEEETFTRIDADGTRIYNKNNLTDPVTKFTKYGTETEELVVKGQGQISGILTQQIGDQTWFSSLL